LFREQKVIVTFRSYDRETDYTRVGCFLTYTYQPGRYHDNWFFSRWEYMHFHPMLDAAALPHIGIWEEGDNIVGVTNYEDKPGTTYFQVHPDYGYIKPEMLAYAAENLAGTKENGSRYVCAFINDFDSEFAVTAKNQGFRQLVGPSECISEFHIPEVFPGIPLPEGYEIISLADCDDLYLTNRLIYRGFDHLGEPPENGPEERRLMQSAPNFDKNLNIIVRAANGDYCSYAGTWYEPEIRIAYVEPVCTDPDYRRLSLGTAAVLESVRRCGELGATLAFVGSEMPFYLNMGFKKLYNINRWELELPTNDR
jgi:GNAT superfamily N-acetyltransferase